LGKEIARILYSKNATVYIGARSREKADAAIDDIKKAAPGSAGDLVFVPLDLADLSSIKASARQILSSTRKIHVLFNNAGVMLPGEDDKTAQGYDLQLGVNNLGTHLFTKLLTPALVDTARDELPATVRVVWVSSSAAETRFVPTGGVPLDNLDYRNSKPSNFARYAISKAGNYLQGAEFARRHAADGVVSIPLNPGNLDSDLWRSQGVVMSTLLSAFLLHPVIYGAYTELFAGLSPEVTMARSGEWG
jgi:NAD(P)-dependent dehydrogenase (short-subunit alcohol dehydrogenase family)